MSPTRYVDRNEARHATRVVVQIHSTPSAVRAHIEWALGGVLGVPTELDWTSQSVEPGSWRAELTCTAPCGTGAEIASDLAAWGRLRFEVTELPLAGAASDQQGLRWSSTPTLGLFCAVTNSAGDIVVHEDRLRGVLAEARQGRVVLADELSDLMGEAWDAELEPFRQGAASGVRWLAHRVS